MISFASTNVLAEEMFGLAMHGEPKYNQESKHLEYANPSAPKGGSVKMAAIGTFDTLNPYSLKGKSAQGLNLVYDRLMARVWDEPFSMYPLIAEKIDVSKGRRSLTVHINPKARFHDNSPITADDVIFSYNTLKEHGRPNMQRIYKIANKVEKIDDLTVHFQFGIGKDQETVMIFAMMPILSKKYWENRDFSATTLEPPLLNGPYKIKSIDAGKKITYERVENYWAADQLPNVGHNNFNEVTYDYFRDDLVAFEAFKKGDFDIRREYDVSRWATNYNFSSLENGSTKKEEFQHGRPERARGIIFNTRRRPFDNRTIRQYMSNVLDFEWINKNLFHDQYKRTVSYFPNSELAFNSKLENQREAFSILSQYRDKIHPNAAIMKWEPEPTPLRQRLVDAGHFLDAENYIVQDGKRANIETGEALEFEIIVNNAEDQKIAQAYQRTIKKLGITARVRLLDSASFIDRITNYDYDMVIHYWRSTLSPGTEQYLYWSCEAAKTTSQWNYAGVCDPVIDELSKNIANARTRKKLVGYAQAIDQILMHNFYMIPLHYSGKDYISYKATLDHPETTPIYGPVLETWWQK